MASSSQVLARKYRPQVFDDLLGQEALVQTIRNAIATNRLAHAYMLTGIRGVGKTTSARIIAKGLNCIGPDGRGGMTPNPCGRCQHCQDIANDAHIDVIEIDAASNTSVDNVREIIESAKYNPVSARFKIYIIDEVHMLSKAAFNALLKTLEEPPERVKFIFATTEVRKVPVTILSRCQRFDLKRVDEKTLAAHLAKITSQEGGMAEEAALHLIARAGEGSVRDSLSLLDQALTQLDKNLTVEGVRHMLGLVDRTALFDLYEAVMGGNMAQMLSVLQRQYECGAEPLVMAQDLLELTHWLTRIKIVPTGLEEDMSVPESEQARGKALAASLSVATLSAAWQVLLKGVEEIKYADYPLKALEMVLIRLAYMSELPSPVQLIQDIKKNGLVEVSRPSLTEGVSVARAQESKASVNVLTPTKTVEPALASLSSNTPQGKRTFRDLSEIASCARERCERLLAFNIENYIRPISIEPGLIKCSFIEGTPRTLSRDLAQFLLKETGERWIIQEQSEGGAKTAHEMKTDHQNQILSEVKTQPLVSAVLKAFPKARIEKIKEQHISSEGEEGGHPEDDTLTSADD